MVSISGPDGFGMVMLGSPTVLIKGVMACRMGDIVMEIPGLALGLANAILMGAPTVMIGKVGMSSPTRPAPRLARSSHERQRHHRPVLRRRVPRASLSIRHSLHKPCPG
jgi:hypothetical protein